MTVAEKFINFLSQHGALVDVDGKFDTHLEEYFTEVFSGIELPSPFDNRFGYSSYAEAAKAADECWYNESRNNFLDGKLQDDEWTSLDHPDEKITETEGLQDHWESFLRDFFTPYEDSPGDLDAETVDEIESFAAEQDLEFEMDDYIDNADEEDEDV